MPIKIQNDLPVKEILEKENLFVVDENRAIHQDIRPLQLCILNLMPKKEETELQLLRMLSNTPRQIDVTFMRMSSHQSLILVASKIADKAGITRSVVVNSLRKFESAGVIESRSSGMKGTYIKVLNDAIYGELKELKKQVDPENQAR